MAEDPLVRAVLDEAMLRPDWPEIRSTAAVQVLARRLSERVGRSPGPGELEEVSAALWAECDVSDRRSLAEWARERQVDEQDLRDLVEADAHRRWALGQVAGELDTATVDRLRLRADFPDLAERARHKERSLRRHGLADESHPVDLEGFHQLLRWWRQQGYPVPSERDVESRFGGWGEFQRIATREYHFSTRCEQDRTPASGGLRDEDLITEPAPDAVPRWNHWRILGPLDDFLAHHWSRRPFRVSGATPPISMAEIDSLVSSGLATPRVLRDNVFENGETYGGEVFSHPGAVIAAFREGAMLVVHRAQEISPSLESWSSELRTLLGVEVNAMIFVAPPASVTDWHRDPTEVLVVQCQGRKHWSVADPEDPDRAPIELTLEPGDVLHVPKGLAHRVVGGDRVAAHVTFCCTAPTWTDTVLELLRAELSDRTVLGERSVVDPRRGPACNARWRSEADRLTAEIRGLLDEFDLAGLRPRVNPSPAQPGHDLGASVTALETGPDDRVRVRSSASPQLRPDPHGPSIVFEGRALRFPHFLLEAVRTVLQQTDGFSARQLDLSESDALVLVRRLLAEGLLERVDGGPGAR